MNPGRFFMPNMSMRPMMTFNPTNAVFRNNMMIPRNVNIISRAIDGIREFNWRNLLSGANKTLNVVNQTIPLIRQAKPMVNNVKSIMKLAKAFGNETKKGNNYKNRNNYGTNNVIEKNNPKSNVNENNNNDNNYPTFFI